MAKNKVIINPRIAKTPEKYPIGTMFSVEDDGGMGGGIYMLVADGSCDRAILSNLAYGTVRNSGMEMEDGFCVSLETLQVCLSHAKYTVVKSVTITSEG